MRKDIWLSLTLAWPNRKPPTIGSLVCGQGSILSALPCSQTHQLSIHPISLDRSNFPSLLLHRALLRRPSSDIITQLTRELRLQQQSLLSSSDISSSSPMGSGSQINIAAASAAPQTSTAAKSTPGQKTVKAGTAGTSRTSTSSGYKSDNSVGSESASRNTLATAGATG